MEPDLGQTRTWSYDRLKIMRSDTRQSCGVVAYFRHHPRTRVTLTKIKVCYLNGFDRNVLIAPAIKSSSGSFRKD